MIIMQVVLLVGRSTGQRRLNNAIHGWQMPYIKRNSVYNQPLHNVVVQLFKDWLIEELRKADDKAYHVGGQFNLGYAAGLDACVEKFVEYVDGRYKI